MHLPPLYIGAMMESLVGMMSYEVGQMQKIWFNKKASENTNLSKDFKTC